MDTNKAAYWIAVGVLALGLNSEYRQGHFPALHQAVDRAGATICRLSTRAEQTVAFARLMSTRKDLAASRLLASADQDFSDRAEMAREEAEQIRETVREQVGDEIRARAEVMRAQAVVQRARIEQLRFETRDQFRLANTTRRHTAFVCPKTGTRIAVSLDGDGADVSTDVEDSSAF